VGQDVVEYVLLILLVVLLVALAIPTCANALAQLYANSGARLNGVIGP
jgi:Flp pilus assembly pilin Flp